MRDGQSDVQRSVLYRLSAKCAIQTELQWRVLYRRATLMWDVLYRLNINSNARWTKWATKKCAVQTVSKVCRTDRATATCAVQTEHEQRHELHRLSYSDLCYTDWTTAKFAVQTELQLYVLYRLSYSYVCWTDWATATCAVKTELQWCVLYRQSKNSDVCCTDELHWCVLNRLCNTQRVLCRLSYMYTLLSNNGACSFVNIFSHDVYNFYYIPVHVFIFGRHVQV